MATFMTPAPAGSSFGSSLGGAATGAVTGGIIGAVVGGLSGLFSDTAHHNEKVQGHLQGYQEIYECAVAGSLPAARKLLWGKTGDYDEIKGQIAAMWAAFAASNPSLAAQAQSLGGQSNDAVALGSFQGCSSSIGIGNPASIASQNVVGVARQDTTGGLGNSASAALSSITSSPMNMLAILAIVGLGVYALRNEGR